MNRLIIGLAVLLIVVIAIPAALVSLFSQDDEKGGRSQGLGRNKEIVNTIAPSDLKNQIPITVYRAEKKKVETLPLEVYIQGVVAAEMPADFELEALKAQAMAARTYIIRRIVQRNYSDVPQGAMVVDTIQNQVYLDEDQLRQQWGRDFSWKLQRIRQAVVETEGKVLTYQGQPIDATFFSTSNGYTENSEDYWGVKIPYLRSVKVPWDTQSPRFQETMVMSVREFEQQLKVRLSGTVLAQTIRGGSSSRVSGGTTDQVSSDRATGWSKVLARTSSNRIAKIQVVDKVYTGREVRELLNLNSSQFNWEVKGDQIYIRTVGYGHGVGMSQWGANGMAKEGRSAAEIVKYFYSGIGIEDYRKWFKQ